MNWLVQNLGMDGIYIDGLGYDREIMKRVRKVMDRARPGCLMDFHTGNHFHKQYGMNNISNFFMEHFPYMSSLWLGEGFNYNEPPDYWLVEISGIPFGMFGEMLGVGNPWRGMLYGMTNRLFYSGGDPREIWRLWDEFGIEQSEMIGYWSRRCPVRTDDERVPATVYLREGEALISLASWKPSTHDCHLTFDWETLGMDPAKATLYAPALEKFQSQATFRPDQAIAVPPGRGGLLLLTEKPHSEVRPAEGQ
jgi:hypothetical protein